MSPPAGPRAVGPHIDYAQNRHLLHTSSRTFMEKKSQHNLFSSDLDGTDAHDKAVNGRKADLYMGHKRRKKKMFSVLRYSGSVHSYRVQLLLFDVWYSSSPFLL